jgi:hypothetical protein
MRLVDTIIGTFLEPPVGSRVTKNLKRWSEKGTYRQWYRRASYAARTIFRAKVFIQGFGFRVWSLGFKVLGFRV